MPVRYREIRIRELDDAVAFAGERGSSATAGQVHHRLSLLAYEDEATVGCALCVEDAAGLFTLELCLTDDAAMQGLGKPLADTALRKVQSAGVGTARIVSLNESEGDRLWEAAGWLSRLPEAAQPFADDEDTADASVAVDAKAEPEETEALEAAQPA